MSGRLMRLHFGIYLKELSSLPAIFFHALRRGEHRPETTETAYRNDLFSIAFLSDEMSDVPCILGPLASSIA
jgi:hypothetical protein